MAASGMEKVVIGVLAVFIVAASGLAVHFQGRATQYQRQYIDTLVQLEEVRDRNATGRMRPAAARPISTGEPSSQPALPEQDAKLIERIAELESELARRDQASADFSFAYMAAPARDEDDTVRERRNWMEDLEENDPERYAAIMQRREEARQRMRESFARKAAHFLNRDTETMAAEERESYEYMLGLLGETWQLSDQLQQDGLTPEQRGAMRRDLYSNMRTLRPMLEAERDREFYELGRQLGYTESGAVEFVQYIHEMLEISSFSGLGGRGRGWHR